MTESTNCKHRSGNTTSKEIRKRHEAVLTEDDLYHFGLDVYYKTISLLSINDTKVIDCDFEILSELCKDVIKEKSR